jgi:hypothetical protein
MSKVREALEEISFYCMNALCGALNKRNAIDHIQKTVEEALADLDDEGMREPMSKVTDRSDLRPDSHSPASPSEDK